MDAPSSAELLATARRHLERAALLGYGVAEDTSPELVKRLEKLEASLDPEKTEESSSQISKLRKALSELGSSQLDWRGRDRAGPATRWARRDLETSILGSSRWSTPAASDRMDRQPRGDAR